MKFAVEVENISFSYGKKLILDRVGFKIKEGEMLGVVGPDGAGKTTLMRMLCGLIYPDSGKIMILGQNPFKERRKLGSKIGYLSQQFSLYGDLTVEENLDFFAGIYSVANRSEIKHQLLKLTKLYEFRNRLADQLSGGMKQKLSLACTLIHKPQVLLLDEPTTGIDPVSRREFWSLLTDLLASGITIIMATPYIDEAQRCNKVALFSEGKIIALDSPVEIIKNNQLNMVVIKCQEPYKVATTVEKMTGVVSAQPFGGGVRVELGESEIENFKSNIHKLFPEVEAFYTTNASLEEVFISIIKREGI